MPDTDEFQSLLSELVPQLPDCLVADAILLAGVLKSDGPRWYLEDSASVYSLGEKPNYLLARLGDRIRRCNPTFQDLLSSVDDESKRKELLDFLVNARIISPDAAVDAIRKYIPEPSSRVALLSALATISDETQRSAIASLILHEVLAISPIHRAPALYRALDVISPQLWRQAREIATDIPLARQEFRDWPDVLAVMTKLFAKAPQNELQQLEDKIWHLIWDEQRKDLSEYSVESIADQLPGRLQERILDVAGSISDESRRTAILEAIATSAKDDLIPCLELTTRPLSPEDRWKVLTSLLPKYRTKLWQELRSTAYSHSNTGDRVRLLVLLVQWAPPPERIRLLDEALEQARRVQDYSWWFETARDLVPRLPNMFVSKVTSIAEEMPEESIKAQLLPAIAKMSRSPDMRRLLALARSISNPELRVAALAGLHPYFHPINQLPVAHEVLQNIPQVRGRDGIVRSLRAAIPIFPEDLRLWLLTDIVPKLLAKLPPLESQSFVVDLAQHLSAEHLPHLLALVIRYHRDALPSLLARSAQHLSPEAREEAFEAISHVLDDATAIGKATYIQGSSLVDLAPWLPDSLHASAIAIAAGLPLDSPWRTSALSALLPHVSGAHRLQVLQLMLPDAVHKREPGQHSDNSAWALIHQLRPHERIALLAGTPLQDQQTLEAGLGEVEAAWRSAFASVTPSQRLELWRNLLADILAFQDLASGAGSDVWGELGLHPVLQEDQEESAGDFSTTSAEASPRTEDKRYTDVTIYEDKLYAGDDLTAANKLHDNEPLIAGKSYTLEVAIRLERTGIGASVDASRGVRSPRRDNEDVTVYVLMRASRPGVEIENSLARMTWPYNADSDVALFHLSTHPDMSWQGLIEVRLYDKSLDLLDIVDVPITVVPLDAYPPVPSGLSPRRLIWRDRDAGVSRVGPQSVSRLLSIQVDSSGHTEYQLRFLFRDQSGDVIQIPVVRDISTGDLERLLVKVRDFWTTLVINNYSDELTVTQTTYGKYMEELARLGMESWSLLFGSRYAAQSGASERLGELLETMQVREGVKIQIIHSHRNQRFVFPWSILYPPTINRSERVDPLGFWGARYQIEQVTSGPKRDALDDEPIDVLFALDSAFGNSESQNALFDKYRKAAGGRLKISNPINDHQTLFKELARNPSAHLVYFYCHGYAATSPRVLRPDGVHLLKRSIEALPAESLERRALETLLALTGKMADESWIYLGNAEIRESELKQQRFFEKRRPIVFLNMCQSADLLPSMSDGLVRVFLDHNASAVLGTESPMTSVFANAFSQVILEALFSGDDIGTALWKARRQFLGSERRNPLGLAYTLYGRATARLGSCAMASPTTVAGHLHAAART